MTTTAEKLIYLNETKTAIKDAITAKGVEVADDATFRSYADSITEIETGLPQQEKSLQVTENREYIVTPDEGHTLSKVKIYGYVPQTPTQDTYTEITSNGRYQIAPDDGYVIRIAEVNVNVPTGGGGDEVEPIVLTGDCSYACKGAMASAYIALFGNTVSTSGITNTANMFHKYQNAAIPFEINMNNSTYNDMTNMFIFSEIEVLPVINNAYPSGLNYFFNGAKKLKSIPENWMDTWDFSRINTYTYANLGNMFGECSSLRSIPAKILSKLRNEGVTSTYNTVYYNGFTNCRVLDELVGLPVLSNTFTSNLFNAFNSQSRLKNLIFETNEDGSAKTANWKAQTIDLSSSLGYTNHYMTITSNGISEDKAVYDDATYQALKDDPDWFATKVAYSRYNHDSAVATINSLPDTSAYLTTNGGTNTIKFQGAAGELTDGGAINTLTEEEIAVATAKGWTVTLV